MGKLVRKISDLDVLNNLLELFLVNYLKLIMLFLLYLLIVVNFF